MPLGVIIESQANTLYERTFVGDNFTTLPKVLSALIASCDTSLGSLPLTVAMGKCKHKSYRRKKVLKMSFFSHHITGTSASERQFDSWSASPQRIAGRVRCACSGYALRPIEPCCEHGDLRWRWCHYWVVCVAEEVLSVFCERYSSMMPQEQMPFVIRREQFLSFDNSCRRAFERGVASLARRCKRQRDTNDSILCDALTFCW